MNSDNEQIQHIKTRISKVMRCSRSRKLFGTRRHLVQVPTYEKIPVITSTIRRYSSYKYQRLNIRYLRSFSLVSINCTNDTASLPKTSSMSNESPQLPLPALNISRSTKGELISTARQSQPSYKDPLKFSVLNARSVKNKSTVICELITDVSCDCLALTETWLRTGDDESVIKSELCPSGYSLKHLPRPDNSGFGGIALVFKDSLKVKVRDTTSYASFELMHVVLHADSQSIHFYVIYRPPPSRKNRLTFSCFIDDFERLIEDISTTSVRFVITGDLNVHFDDALCSETARVLNLLQAANMQQLVSTSTHRCGHILDPVITSITSNPINNIQVDDYQVSDHFLVNMFISYEKSHQNIKKLTYRQYSKIERNSFCLDVSNRIAAIQLVDKSATEILESYNFILRDVLDQHAPEVSRLILGRLSSPWIDDEIRQKRKSRRRAERRWRETRLMTDRQHYRHICRETARTIEKRKREYYNSKISELKEDHSLLFNFLNRLSARSVRRNTPR